MCLIAIGVWKETGKATYANLLVGVILIVSFFPTLEGVWYDPTKEQALPWVLWTIAFAASTANGIRRRKEQYEVDWRLMLFVPVTMLFAHATVAALSNSFY
jgi:hypothetical protein